MRKTGILLLLLLTVNLLMAQKFKSKELFITSFDTVRINGILLVPKKLKENIPLVIIIAGSGPTNKDGNNAMMKNNSLKYLAESLSENKIASFRYDKRAIGKSVSARIAESDLRFEHYVNDVVEIVKYFNADKRFSSVTIIGHSEGSLIGMIASEKIKVDKFISIAGAGRSADNILKDQLKEQYGINYISPMIDSLKNGYEIKELGSLKALLRPSVQPYIISWFKYDPQKEIAKLTCPVLILQGDNDIQVKEKEAELLHLANKESDYVLIKKMNHIMKIVGKDYVENLKSYYNSELPISKTLSNKIVSFVNR